MGFCVRFALSREVYSRVRTNRSPLGASPRLTQGLIPKLRRGRLTTLKLNCRGLYNASIDLVVPSSTSGIFESIPCEPSIIYAFFANGLSFTVCWVSYHIYIISLQNSSLEIPRVPPRIVLSYSGIACIVSPPMNFLFYQMPGQPQPRRAAGPRQQRGQPQPQGGRGGPQARGMPQQPQVGVCTRRHTDFYIGITEACVNRFLRENTPCAGIQGSQHVCGLTGENCDQRLAISGAGRHKIGVAFSGRATIIFDVFLRPRPTVSFS